MGTEKPENAETRAIELLAQAGLRAVVRGNAELEVVDGDDVTLVEMKVRRSRTYEWEAQQILAGTSRHIALAVPHASKALIAMAHTHPRLSVVSIDDGHVIWKGVERGRPQDPVSQAPVGRLRSAWGRWALMRALAVDETPRSQADLARAIGISQPAVSMALKDLDGTVERTSAGWRALDPEQMWDAFLDEYPGPGGFTTYWYGLESITTQGETVRNLEPCRRASSQLGRRRG
ncbi:MarR family transcriptional regulator [Demequina sediminicola]|uniref:MarR family transcriptional regulator n=1 Tax=Demequina sediminicola TaxID=1095026 RepID=UPI000AA4F682|nr:MarR family transcriptional regulator [Demequina sediminicola]